MTVLSVVIPVWNLWEMSAACLRSLACCSPSAALEVIVVDNGSTDESAHGLEPLGRELFGARYVHLRLESNQGFARACNLGAQTAVSPYLFFLNNDTVLTENWLPPLLNAFQERPQLGMAGSLLLYPETLRVQHCGVTFSPGSAVSHLYEQFPADHPLIHKKRRLQAISGAAVLLPRTLFKECGGFFDGYQNGFEDLDLCGTLRQKNFQVDCISASRIIHHTSQTPGRKDHDAANAALLYHRHPRLASPDVQCFARDDGFEIVLTPDLTCAMCLPAIQEGTLSASLKNATPEHLARRLNENPLWNGGYTLLAAALEARLDWAQALSVRSLQCQFFPLEQNYLACARTAARVQESTVRSFCLLAIADIRKRCENHADLSASFSRIQQYAQSRHDELLLKSCREWKEKYGEGRGGHD